MKEKNCAKDGNRERGVGAGSIYEQRQLTRREIHRQQLQPLPRHRLARRAPKPEGGQAHPRRAKGRVRPEVLEVVGESSPPSPPPTIFPFAAVPHMPGQRRDFFFLVVADEDLFFFVAQNGKQSDPQSLTEANNAIAAKNASS